MKKTGLIFLILASIGISNAFSQEVNLRLHLVRWNDSEGFVPQPFDYTYLFINGKKSIIGYQMSYKRKIVPPATITVRHFNYCEECLLKVEVDGKLIHLMEQESDGVTYKVHLN